MNHEATAEASSSSRVHTPAPAPRPTMSSKLRHAIKPHGNWNRNAVFVLALCGIGCASVYMAVTGTGGSVLSTTGSNQPQSISEGKAKNTKLLTSGGGDGTLGPPQPINASFPGAGPGPTIQPLTAPPTALRTTFNPRPQPYPSEAPQTPASPVAPAQKSVWNYAADDPFSSPPKSRDEAVASSTLTPIGANPTAPQPKPDEPSATLPRGTRIKLALLEPAQSSIPDTVRVKVVEAVRDEAGAVLIAAGVTGELPFAAREFHGRLVLDANRTGHLRVHGKEIALAGSIKGADGRPGIKGEVKSKGQGTSLLGRAARIPLRAGASVFGGIGGTAASEAEQVINERSYGGYGLTREVVAKAGTIFTFVVGL